MSFFYENFISLLSKQTDDLQELEYVLKETVQNYSKQPDLLPKQIPEIFSRSCKWLKENPISKKVPSLFRFLVYLYEILGFTVEFNFNEYYKTSDKIEENDPSKLEKQNLEGFENDKENKLDNPLLNFEIFHLAISIFNSILTKNQIQGFKFHLVVLLPIFSIYAADKKIQDLIRRQKFIKSFLRLFKEIMTEKEKLQTIDIELSNYIFHLLAKLTYRNRKNQDYFIKKNGHEFLKGVLIGAKELNLIKGGICTLSNCCDKNDTRLLLWCGGFLTYCLQKIAEKSDNLLHEYRNSHIPEKQTDILNIFKEIEIFLILLWKMSLDTDEILEEILNSNQFNQIISIFDQLKSLISRTDHYFPYYTKCISLLIGTIRHIAAIPKFRTISLEKYLGFSIDFMLFFDSEGKKSEEFLFFYKEISAVFGLFVIDGNIINELLNKGIVNSILRNSLVFFENSRIIKTILGFLTNLAGSTKGREFIGKEKDFYVLIYNVLEKYDYSGAIIEYSLKLIINMGQDNLAFKNFSSPKFIFKLLFLLFLYKADEINSVLIIKNLKNLCNKGKVIETFMNCIKELEMTNKEFIFLNVLIETMKSSIETPQNLFDIIVFLSMLTLNDENIKQKLSNNENFVALIRDFLDLNKKKKDVLQSFSTYIAYLPIEEFNFII